MNLIAIPIVDVREGGTLRHARERCDRARGLRDTCVAWFPAIARPLMPALDAMARGWLTRSQSPYVDEVRAIASALGFPGIWFLNGSYQWSCTALARDEGGAPWLARTLDWPFPGLGRFVDVARMEGPAGEFYNVTWPGYVGVLTAMAPGRFAACINQAPMRRRTQARALRLVDFALNGMNTLRRERAIPPDQLLRLVFEQACNYADARHMLETTRVARPVIYTLAGIRPGECCVIERMEDGFKTYANGRGAANDWIERSPFWEGRIGAKDVLKRTFDEAAAFSRARRESLEQWRGSFARERFAWVVPPVLNPYTRLALEMCAARGVLRAVGYELADGELHAQPATLPCEVHADAVGWATEHSAHTHGFDTQQATKTRGRAAFDRFVHPAT
jgi:hypothetical protein